MTAADRPATAFLPSDVQLLRDVANTFNPDTFDEHNKLEDLADKIEAVLFPAADRPVEGRISGVTISATCQKCGVVCAPEEVSTHVCRPVENSELRTLMAEMAKQASLGHKRFCVGIHDYGHLGVEEEWIDWPEAFQRLAAKGKKCAVCGKPAVTADVDGEPLCRKCFDACPDEDGGEDSDAE